MAHITQEQYQKLPTESIEQYNQRIASLRADIGQISEPAINLPAKITDVPSPTAILTTDQQITGQALQTVPSVDYQVPQPQPVFPVSSLPSELPSLPAIEPEARATDLSTQIQRLNERLLGQTALRTEEETRAGIPELRKTQADLAGQLKILQAEAQAIPLQLEQESFQRGRTISGILPLQQEKLRTNAIRALTTSALLQASQGQLAMALDQVDRAVATRYEPILEEIKIKQANLHLILQSPEFSRSEKERAIRQLQAQKDREHQLDRQTADQKLILGYAVNAAQNGASTLDLRNITNAKSPQEALQIAAPYLRKKREIPSEITFTKTQTAKGAVIADLPIADFQRLDIDTQNFFINNSDQIKAKKKLIDEAKLNKEDPTSVEREIETSSLPQAVKDSLKRYLNSVFPPKTQESRPWWKRWFGIQ